MIFKWKSFGALFLGIVLIFSLAACGSNNNSGGGADDNGKVTLTLWNTWTDDTSETKALKAHLKQFNDEHPNIEIKQQQTPSDQYKTKLKTQAAGKQLPELFQVWPGAELEPIVKGKAVQPINDIAENYKDLIPQSTMNDFMVDGNTYAIPATVAFTNVVYYDKDMLAKEGYDKFPTTYADLKDLINKLNAKGITPMQLGDKAGWPLQSIYMSTIGDRLTGSDFLKNVLAGKAKFTDPEFVKALGVVKELKDMGAFNKDANTIDDAQARGNFLNGKSAIFISGSWSTSAMLDEMPEGKHVGAAIFPSIEGGKGDPTKVSGVGSIAIAENSNLKGKEKEAADTFLKFLYSKELYTDLLNGGQLVPANVDIPEDANPLLKEVYDATKGGTAPVYDATLTAELTQTINNGLQGILTGSTTPEKLAKQMQSQVND